MIDGIDLTQVSRKKLQVFAKKLGIKANQSSALLIQQITAANQESITPSASMDTHVIVDPETCIDDNGITAVSEKLDGEVDLKEITIAVEKSMTEPHSNENINCVQESEGQQIAKDWKPKVGEICEAYCSDLQAWRNAIVKRVNKKSVRAILQYASMSAHNQPITVSLANLRRFNQSNGTGCAEITQLEAAPTAAVENSSVEEKQEQAEDVDVSLGNKDDTASHAVADDVTFVEEKQEQAVDVDVSLGNKVKKKISLANPDTEYISSSESFIKEHNEKQFPIITKANNNKTISAPASGAGPRTNKALMIRMEAMKRKLRMVSDMTADAQKSSTMDFKFGPVADAVNKPLNSSRSAPSASIKQMEKKVSAFNAATNPFSKAIQASTEKPRMKTAAKKQSNALKAPKSPAPFSSPSGRTVTMSFTSVGGSQKKRKSGRFVTDTRKATTTTKKGVTTFVTENMSIVANKTIPYNDQSGVKSFLKSTSKSTMSGMNRSNKVTNNVGIKQHAPGMKNLSRPVFHR